MKSKILELIKADPNWKATLKEKKIAVKEEYPFVLCHYLIDANFFDEIVQEARGIIIDIERGEVACWPFRKFGNYEEPYADEIDWSSAKIQDKLDGSLVKLWYNRKKGDWTWSTSRMIDAADASLEQITNSSYLGLIHESRNYKDIDFNGLHKEKTYLFEITSPKNKIVIFYPTTDLWHIGTRNNITGEETNESIGIQKPDTYALTSLTDCISAVEALNDGSSVKKEGFVVVDNAWHRIKIKSPAYFIAHHIKGNGFPPKRRALEIIESGAADEISRENLMAGVVIRYYQYQIAKLLFRADRYMDYARTIYEEMGRNRSATAKKLLRDKSPLQHFAFKAINTTLTAEEVYKTLPLASKKNLLPDWNEKMEDI